jgi:hypothetical protein
MSNEELLSLEDIQLLLKDKRLYVVSKATGLSFPTLKKMADGKKENFTYKTIKAVSDYRKLYI